LSTDITLPEVQAIPQIARFYAEEGRDYVEISFVGAKDTVVQKVKPEHMARFKRDWDAYCDGRPADRRAGTPLTDVPGVDDMRAEFYFARNIHNAEELSFLSDAQCQAVGHGTLTQRESARKVLMIRKFDNDEKNRKALSDASAAIGPVPAETYASKTELLEIKQSVDTLAQSMAALVQALTPAERKKPGRPKKETAQ
jgi:hypothetical protein